MLNGRIVYEVIPRTIYIIYNFGKNTDVFFNVKLLRRKSDRADNDLRYLFSFRVQRAITINKKRRRNAHHYCFFAIILYFFIQEVLPWYTYIYIGCIRTV